MARETRRWLEALLLAMIMTGTACARDEAAQSPADGGESTATTIRLWEGPAPLAEGKEPADIPTITVYSPDPDKANGAAAVICPGGGYHVLVTSYEGKEVAKWLNSLGVTGIVLHYRVAPYKHPAPMIDVQRAIRMARGKADQFHIDPERIGVVGFSAGGHVASTAATHFNDRPIPPADKIDRLSARPDFVILAYPVVSMEKGVTHAGSKKNLLGKNPDPQLVRAMSNDLAVTKKTPPTFLFHTAEDTVVPAENSVRFFLACLREGVPAELHVFEKGRHGAGLGRDNKALKVWPSLCETWMREHGWLDQ